MKFRPWIRKSFWIDGALITSVTAILAAMLYVVGISLDVFDPLGKAVDSFNMTDGFFYSRSGRTPVPNDRVVIVDVAECDSRAEIAGIVDRIADAEPAVLAVDIIFGPSATMDRAADSLLVESFRRFVTLSNGRLVLARHGDIRSFFADEIECAEGDVSLDGDVARTFDAGSCSFAGTILDSYGASGSRPRPKSTLIDYTPAATAIYTPGQTFSREGMKGRIVLIGDNSDLRDYHDVPVPVDGSCRCSGLKIYAQELYTVLEGRHFKAMPGWAGLLLALIAVWVFASMVSYPLKHHSCRFDNLQSSALQAIVFVLLFLVSYCLFWWLGLCVSLAWTLVGMALVGLAAEIYYFVKCSVRKKK